MLVTAIDGVPSARGFSRHLERFTRGLETLGVTVDPSPFLTSSRNCIHEYALNAGYCFPRLECWDDNGSFILTLNLRAAPQRTDAVSLTTRERMSIATPHLKGPNIATYSACVRDASSEVLLTQEGAAVEGTTTTLMWWEDNTLMILPGAGTNRVHSVTEQLILELATSLHQPTAVARRSPQELASHEIWAVNALHGIRPVTSIDGQPLTSPDADRLSRWRAHLDRTWEPVRMG